MAELPPNGAHWGSAGFAVAVPYDRLRARRAAAHRYKAAGANHDL
jgi:hypothetical protein